MQNPTIKNLENFIGYCSVKNNVISKNIANVGTKNYKQEDVVFKNVLEDNMNSDLKITNNQHIESPASAPDKFEIVTTKNNGNVSGVNDVDIDEQMADLAKNNLNFRFATKRLGDYFKDMQCVIKGVSR